MSPKHTTRAKKTARSRSARRGSRAGGRSRVVAARYDHTVFFPLVFACFILWVIYRSIFTFPVWFDETLGKALFFGLPAWLYVAVTGMKAIPDTFDLPKLRRGLLLGIAIGGVFGFVASLLAILQKGGQVQAAAIFESSQFWGEFVLAIATGFWETLFFFSFVMTVVLDKFKKWPMLNQVLLTAAIFIAFHIPNAILRFGGMEVAYQAVLLFMFAIGQGYLFSAERNGYALVLSHAIWGMVLLVHF